MEHSRGRILRRRFFKPNSTHTDRAPAPMSNGCWIALWLHHLSRHPHGDPPPDPSSCGSVLATASGLLPLIWPPDDRSPMRSDAPRSVGAVGAANRTVVPITVTVRICLANSHSPIGADASGSIDAIDTSGCLARLGEHEGAKCNHDGEHRRAVSGEPQRSVFHFRYLLESEYEMIIPLLADKQIK